jgi:transposase
METLAKVCAGLDVHRSTVVCTLLRDDAEGRLSKETREVPTFRRALEPLAQWLRGAGVEVAVMEATGVYWKAVYEALEEAGLKVVVVNARHVKKVPGRKTDVQDSEWLAELARCGLLRASFIPPKDLRQLRLLTRYRRKLTGYAAGEKNRLHKVLDDCGIRLGCVVSDIDGVSSSKMIRALIEGHKLPQEIADLAVGSLKEKKPELIMALEGRISDRHRFVLKLIQSHIRWLEKQIEEVDRQVVMAMQPYHREWELLQTIPGLDRISAAMLLTEIGVDTGSFGSKDRLSSWVGMCPGNNESAGKKKKRSHPEGKRVYQAAFV